jgi:hypothetical protein
MIYKAVQKATEHPVLNSVVVCRQNVIRTVDHTKFTIDYFKGLLVKYLAKFRPPDHHHVDLING